MFGLAVDKWASTVGTPSYVHGNGQLVLASLNGLPTLPANRIYRMTALTNPGTPTEVVLGIFEATGLSGSTLTGVTAAAGYTDVDLASGVVLQIRTCKATIDELQAGIEANTPGGITGDIQFNNNGAFAGSGPSWDGNTFTVTNMTTGGMIAQGFSTAGVNAGYTLTNRTGGAQVWSIASTTGDFGVFNLILGAYGLLMSGADNSMHLYGSLTVDGGIHGTLVGTRVTSNSGAFDLSTGNWFFRTLDGTNGTPTVTNEQANQLFTVELLQDSTGSRTVSWGSFGTITWMTSGGTAPTIASGANLRTTLLFKRIAAGTFLGWLTGSQA